MKSTLASRLTQPERKVRPTALLVDLNNFSTFPTLAIGLLVASLRNSGYETRVICPLAYGVPATERERRETPADHFMRHVHHSTWQPFQTLRDLARRGRTWWLNRPDTRVLEQIKRALEDGPDVLLISAYLQHFQTVQEIGRLASARRIPLVLGGPVFNMRSTSEAWRSLPGLTAIIGAESDLVLPQILHAVRSNSDLLKFDGVLLPDGRRSQSALPLRDLDEVPIPDFSDFPWDKYRVRVVPVMAGRGCQWNRCTFCSDIASASGRTFRTRSVKAVLNEIAIQAKRYHTQNFMFLDLKLNSYPSMFRGIIENIQSCVPGAQWIGTVHVDQRHDNGLSCTDLRAAAATGMRRISFGLESGSQRMLELMDKGSSVQANSEFIRNAHEAGLSVRCTMFKGYPGETAEDLELTAEFLEKHIRLLDRVRYNDFSIHEDSIVYTRVLENPAALSPLKMTERHDRSGRLHYVNTTAGTRAYRRANARVLRAVYAINRRAVRFSAQAFDGLM